ncbi:MAG: GTPase HflX [Spirochaetes bacterium]|jgi:GTP-binding protein HflX|nr:GTPase HflX [Spirochaetota bacterium]
MDASVNRIPSSRDEKSFLLSIQLPDMSREEAEYSLEELKMLVTTAGGLVCESRIIRRKKYDSSFIAGKGFWEESASMFDELGVKLVVLDVNNLRPGQIRNIEEKLNVRVIGRTEIILDIFACRARSHEAQMQVELAKLSYMLPRLKGYGSVLSRQGGGIGSRGAGESMLEKDRRHIQKRITTIKSSLKKVQNHRSLTRKSRKGAITCAVAGYTNAGKSTLINSLAGDDLFVENRLFATLESYTRSAYIGNNRTMLLTDTVGFIRNLPHDLIASFRSTFEEITAADIILHVVDCNSIDIGSNISTVEAELDRIEGEKLSVILYFNKADAVSEDFRRDLSSQYPNAVFGSALKKSGLADLMEALNSAFEDVAGRKYPHYLNL